MDSKGIMIIQSSGFRTLPNNWMSMPRLSSSKIINPFATADMPAICRLPESRDFSFSCPPFKAMHDDLKTLSLGFRRLGRKAQIFSVKVDIQKAYPKINEMLTNRLVHCLMVESIAELICLPGNLNLNTFLARAGASVHDVSHAPWGHPGERALSPLFQKYLGHHFLHSIAGVTLLDRIEGMGPKKLPYNLDLRALEAIAFHDGEAPSGGKWHPSPKRTWEQFDADCMEKQKDSHSILVPSTLEGLVVRFSDKIAFLPDDIETCIFLGIFKREELPKTILGNYGPEIRKRLIEDLIINSREKPYISHGKEVSEAINILQKFFIERVFKSRDNVIQQKLNELFETMFGILLSHLKEGRADSPIARYKNYMISGAWEGLKTDEARVLYYIAGMTEEYFRDVFEKVAIKKRELKLLDSIFGPLNTAKLNRLSIGLENIAPGENPF